MRRLFQHDFINWVVIPLLIVTILAVTSLLAGCGGSKITVGNISGFRHETSVNVGFDPEIERTGFLSVSNDGTVTFITERPKLPGPGPVGIGQRSILNLYTVTKEGKKTHRERSYPRWEFSHDREYIYATDEDGVVNIIDRRNLDIREIDDDTSLIFLTRPGNHECLNDSYITYRWMPPKGESSWQNFGIYDIQARKDRVAYLEEGYELLRGTDLQNDLILVEAFPKIDRSELPVCIIVTTSGEIRAKIPTDYYGTARHFDAILAEDGLAMFSGSNEMILKLRKYDYNADLLWSQKLPVMGNPTLKRIQDGDREILALTTWSHDAWYVGFFDSDNGTPLYENTFDGTRQIEMTDESGTFYLFKEWDGYYGTAAPTSRISLYEQGMETAFADITEGIYYFAASPDGNYFAVVTGKAISIFSGNAINRKVIP